MNLREMTYASLMEKFDEHRSLREQAEVLRGRLKASELALKAAYKLAAKYRLDA